MNCFPATKSPSRQDLVFKQLKKALLERALGAELTHQLGYEKGDPAGRGSDNHRNGSYPKTVLTEDGAVHLDVPRDRNGTFDPQIVPKGETRLDGFDDKIISITKRRLKRAKQHYIQGSSIVSMLDCA
jgi:putative transposase